MKGLSASRKMHVLSHSLLHPTKARCDERAEDVTPSQAGCFGLQRCSTGVSIQAAFSQCQGCWEEWKQNRESGPKFLFISCKEK